MGNYKNRRAQTPKASKRTIDKIGQAEIDRAGSNAAGPHRLKTDYRRKPKHVGRGWSDD